MDTAGRIKHHLVLEALNSGATAFLLSRSWRIAASGGRINSTPDRDQVSDLGAGIFQWVNPKSWLVTASSASLPLLAAAHARHRTAMTIPKSSPRGLFLGGRQCR